MVAETAGTVEQEAATAAAAPDEQGAQQPEATPAPDQRPEPVREAEVPETEPAAAPETVETGPDHAALLGDLDEDALSELGPVKDLLARREESMRRRTEVDSARQASQLRREELVGDEATKAIRQGFSVGDAGELQIDDEAVAGGVAGIFAGSVDLAVRTLGGIVDETVPKDFPIEREAAQDLQQALTAFEQNPTTGAGSLIRQYVSLSNRAAVAAAREEMRVEVEKDVRKDYEAKATVDERRRADDAQAASPGPTRGVQGTAGNAWSSQSQMDRAHRRDEITTSEYGQLVQDGTYDSLPYR